MADRGPPGRAPTTEEQLRRNWVVEPPRLTGKLQVVDYDPRWPALFRREAARIRALLGERALRLEHIGSTSVPEPAAKPIIDILLVVADPADEPAYLPDLEAAGYVLIIREPEWFQHRCLKGPDTNLNLHVHPPDSPEIERSLLFRERLRTAPPPRVGRPAGRAGVRLRQPSPARSQLLHSGAAASGATDATPFR
jgi:GrpB-like predicted nucleotidyltransferase (UPF0157 family)